MMFSPDLLAGRHVLITGGGTGLGRAIGERFLSLGASLVICGRRVAVLDAAAAEMRTARPGADITTIGCDVRDPAQVDAMLDTIWQRRPLDILVNNAAGNFLAQSHRLSVRAVDAVLGIVRAAASGVDPAAPGVSPAALALVTNSAAVLALLSALTTSTSTLLTTSDTAAKSRIMS